MITAQLKRNCLLALFLGLIALSLLAPIASNTYLPAVPDYANDVAEIIQAKMGLDQGQFPLHTLPWQDKGLGNAFFTFYSPLPQHLAGYTYQLMNSVTSTNPFFIMKLILWFSLFIAGIYIYRLMLWLIQSPPIALLCSLVYMTAPYFIINIDSRGAFSEAFAQGLIPLILFYNLKMFKEPFQLRTTIFATLSWAALITSHLVTTVYTSSFVGLFLFLLALQKKSELKKLFLFAGIYCFAILLSFWYIIPVVLISPFLNIANLMGNPAESSWLTPLSNLLSIRAISPVPLYNRTYLPDYLYPGIGWPILFGIASLCYFISLKKLYFVRASLKSILALLGLFFISIFLTWSPFDFWQFLPKIANICQYSYRLLAQSMWIGTILFGYALLEISRGKWDIKETAMAIIFIVIMGSSWLNSNMNYAETVNEMLKTPSINYSKHDYLVPSKDSLSTIQSLQDCQRHHAELQCHVQVTKKEELVQLPQLYYPQLLNVKINGVDTTYLPIESKDYVMTGLKLQPGTYDITVKFVGIAWANTISLIAWAVILIGLCLPLFNYVFGIFFTKKLKSENI